MHTAYVRPGGVAFDTKRFFKRSHDFLLPFSRKITELKNY